MRCPERGGFLWLDALTRRGLVGLAPRLSERELPAGLLVLATMHQDPMADTRVPAQVKQVLISASVVGIGVGVLSPGDQKRLRSHPAYAHLTPVLEAGGAQLMGRLLVSLDRVEAALQPAPLFGYAALSGPRACRPDRAGPGLTR